GARVTGDDLGTALAVREALRALLLANNGAPLDPRAVTTLNGAADRSRLRVSFSPSGRAELLPDEPNVPGALSRILAVTYTAMADESWDRSEEHTSELQSPYDLVCRLLLEKKKKKKTKKSHDTTITHQHTTTPN